MFQLRTASTEVHRTMTNCPTLLKHISAHRPSPFLHNQSYGKATSAIPQQSSTLQADLCCTSSHFCDSKSRLCMQSALPRQAGSAPRYTVLCIY